MSQMAQPHGLEEPIDAHGPGIEVMSGALLPEFKVAAEDKWGNPTWPLVGLAVNLLVSSVGLNPPRNRISMHAGGVTLIQGAGSLQVLLTFLACFSEGGPIFSMLLLAKCLILKAGHKGICVGLVIKQSASWRRVSGV